MYYLKDSRRYKCRGKNADIYIERREIAWLSPALANDNKDNIQKKTFTKSILLVFRYIDWIVHVVLLRIFFFLSL